MVPMSQPSSRLHQASSVMPSFSSCRLNPFALVGPQSTSGGLMAASRDVVVHKLTVDPMRGCEFSTQFVGQPTKCDRAKAE